MRGKVLAVTQSLIKIKLMLFLIIGLALISGYQDKVSGSEEGKKIVVKKDDKVKIHCTVSLKDGTVFQNTQPGKPLEFTVGSKQMPHGLDQAVRGMKLNERKKVTVESKDAYGKRNEDLLMKFDKNKLSKNFKPSIGMNVIIENIPGTIVEIDEKQIILDGNHPLAGKDVVFDIRVVGIE